MLISALGRFSMFTTIALCFVLTVLLQCGGTPISMGVRRGTRKPLPWGRSRPSVQCSVWSVVASTGPILGVTLVVNED